MPLCLNVRVQRALTETCDGHEVRPVAVLQLKKDRVARPSARPNFPSQSAGSSVTTHSRV
jgi:hypothetical protein